MNNYGQRSVVEEVMQSRQPVPEPPSLMRDQKAGGQIAEEWAAMGVQLERLDKIVSVVGERFQAVMLPEDAVKCAGEPGGPKAVRQSEIAEAIAERSRNISFVANRLSSYIDRCQL